ncbi:ABC transporter substrate-binding protein [Burkholderia sp. WAC0059]|uniref:ABC transporter substrate-binding protein n=1 Tax=Burkholderia sp. WAC0059 TaxID=2066022 RepID=UPI000C7F6238|nr:ABC transporter substrate-binding protein [Burkholderia sp. WAC0059]PLZ02847.1 ABC transporter substrate-binding protein [Burkholderia sp. WAC0059]
MTMPDTLPVSAIAPSGTLRVAINLGNAVLARREADGRPAGVSVDLAAELARRLGLAVEHVVVDAAAKSVEAVRSGAADVGFFAVDPVRGAGISFTAPYVLIEGCYLVRDDSPIVANADVDRDGNRVAVGGGSAYDLFLSRELKAAQIVRVTTSQAVVETFVAQRLEVAAGVRQQLEADRARHDDLRLIDEPFMVIRQAMGVAQGRGDAALRYVAAFVEEMKASGRVAQLLARHGIEGVSVAPPASADAG